MSDTKNKREKVKEHIVEAARALQHLWKFENELRSELDEAGIPYKHEVFYDVEDDLGWLTQVIWEDLFDWFGVELDPEDELFE